MRRPFARHTPDGDLTRNKLEQARVRLGICAFMGICFLVSGHASHYLYLLFIVYSLVLLISAYRLQHHSRMETVLSLLLDNYFTIAGLHVTGQHGTFLFIFLIQISFGYGLRFGRAYLLLSLLAACGGVLALYQWSPAWRGNAPLAVAYILGTPFIGLYVYHLAERVRRQRAESDRRAQEISRLLAFVAHDIRTPLHALLATLTAARENSREDHTRARLLRMEASVNTLAVMASKALGLSRGAAAGANTDDDDAVWTLRWLLGIVQTYRDDLASTGSAIEYDLDLEIPPYITFNLLDAERLLLNTLSNATRHAGQGGVTVAVAWVGAQDGRGELQVTVRNHSPPVAAHSTNDDAGVRQPVTADPYSGARLGLEVATELARVMGGSFTFRGDRDGVYETDLSIPARALTPPPSSGILLPVVLLSRDQSLLARFREALASHTNVVALREPGTLARAPRALTHDIAALIVDAAMSGRADRARGLEKSPRLYSVVRKSGRQTAGALVDGAFVTLGDFASPDAIINAVIAEDTVRENAARFAGNAPWSGTGLLRGTRVLLVDDNPSNCALFAEDMRTSGAILSVANSVDDGKALLTAGTFDAVVFDWNIGDESGAELVSHLDGLAPDERPLAMVLSAASAEAIRSALGTDSGVCIIQRPVATAAIIRTLAGALGIADGAGISAWRPPRGGQIFDIRLYENLAAAGSSDGDLLRLLGRFTQTMAAQLARLRAACEQEAAGRDRHLHAIKSMAYAAGAYALGDFMDLFAGAGDASSPSERLMMLAQAESLWVITLAHVDVFRLGLAERECATEVS